MTVAKNHLSSLTSGAWIKPGIALSHFDNAEDEEDTFEMPFSQSPYCPSGPPQRF